MKLNGPVLIGISTICLLAIMVVVHLAAPPHIQFSLDLDGNAISPDKVPEVQIDGHPFISGDKIGLGEHHLSIEARNIEPFQKTVWSIIGIKDIGTLHLVSETGELDVTASPDGSDVLLKQGTNIVAQSKTPAHFSKVAMGSYELEVEKSGYEESSQIIIDDPKPQNVEIALQLGRIVLVSIPADSEYALSGGGHNWQGQLPIEIPDVPVGDYDLTVRRGDWQTNAEISVFRNATTTNITEFKYGSITLSSSPDNLIIFSNGVDIGRSPLTLTGLKPGNYTFAASDGDNEMAAGLEVKPDQETDHNFIFRYATVNLDSVPSGATVIRHGKTLGVTPLTLERILVGETPINLQQDGYLTTNYVIATSNSSVANCMVTLINRQYWQAMAQARSAFANRQFDESLKQISVALGIQPSDQDATELQMQVSEAQSNAQRLQIEAEQKAEEAKRAAERAEIVAVIEKAINAVGGREALDRFRFSKLVENSTGTKNGVEFEMLVTIYMDLPNRIRLEQEIANKPANIGPLVINLNGGKPKRTVICLTEDNSWEIVQTLLGEFQQPVPDNVQRRLRESLYFQECSTLVPLLRPDFILEKVPDSFSPPDGTVAFVARKAGMPRVLLIFDKDDGFLARMDMEITDDAGNPVRASTQLSQYADFSGLKAATQTTYSEGGVTYSAATISALDPLNSAYESIFAPPTTQ